MPVVDVAGPWTKSFFILLLGNPQGLSLGSTAHFAFRAGAARSRYGTKINTNFSNTIQILLIRITYVLRTQSMSKKKLEKINLKAKDDPTRALKIKNDPKQRLEIKIEFRFILVRCMTKLDLQFYVGPIEKRSEKPPKSQFQSLWRRSCNKYRLWISGDVTTTLFIQTDYAICVCVCKRRENTVAKTSRVISKIIGEMKIFIYIRQSAVCRRLH